MIILIKDERKAGKGMIMLPLSEASLHSLTRPVCEPPEDRPTGCLLCPRLRMVFSAYGPRLAMPARVLYMQGSRREITITHPAAVHLLI